MITGYYVTEKKRATEVYSSNWDKRMSTAAGQNRFNPHVV